MDNLFYPGLVAEAKRDILRSSPIWSLVTGICLLSEGRLKVIGSRTGNTGSVGAMLALPNGMGAFCVAYNGTVFTVDRRVGAVDSSHWETMLESKSATHILKLMGEDRSSKTYKRRASKKSVRNIGDNLTDYFNALIEQFNTHTVTIPLEYLRRRLIQDNPFPDFSCSSEALRYLLDVYANPHTQLSALPEQINAVNALLRDRAQYDDKAKLREIAAAAIVGKDKWILQLYPTKYFAIGKVSCKDAKLHEPYFSPSDLKPQIVRDFTLHKRLEDMPSDIKEEVMARLTMDKAFLGEAFGGGTNADPELDPLGVIPMIDINAPQIGYFSNSTGYRPSFGMTVMFDAF